MAKTVTRTLETLSGIGVVFANSDQLATARYVLRVTQEQIIIESFGTGTEELPGLKDVTGQINILSGEKFLIGLDGLVLRLDDGRDLDFVVRSGDPVSGRYTVLGNGGFAS